MRTLPIDVTESGIVTEARAMQCKKANLSIWATELPIVTAVSEVHPSKAYLPMCVIELGIVMLMSFLHFLNVICESAETQVRVVQSSQ